jgi:hypothetical protein
MQFNCETLTGWFWQGCMQSVPVCVPLADTLTGASWQCCMQSVPVCVPLADAPQSEGGQEAASCFFWQANNALGFRQIYKH